jgi:hypothetical protein
MPGPDVGEPRKVVEVREYEGESSIALAATQLGSGYSETRKRQIVNEWADFFKAGPSPIRTLQFTTRTPKRLFAALSGQPQLTFLQVKWGDYDDLQPLSGMQELMTLRLRGASKVRDLRPLAGLQNVRTLQVEGLKGLIDASPVGQMRSVTDLELGGDWIAPKNVRITSVRFLREMTQIQRLLLHTLIVDDLNYHPLLALPKLRSVRVMATRGMVPSIEELIERLPWEA